MQTCEYRLEAVTVILSEISLALLFALLIVFNFHMSLRGEEVMKIGAVICIYAAVSVPTVSGFLGLCMKLKDS